MTTPDAAEIAAIRERWAGDTHWSTNSASVRPTIDTLLRALETVTAERDALIRAQALIADAAFEGLHTDGAHHKQWFLEEVLNQSDPMRDADWTPGVQP